MPNRQVSATIAIAAGLLSAASAVGSSYLLRHGGFAGGPRLLIALLPVPFFVAFIVTELLWIRQCDEFHRRVLLESLAVAFPAAIVLAVTTEAVQKAGYLTDWTVGDVWPFMALVWVPALWFAVRRYR